MKFSTFVLLSVVVAAMVSAELSPQQQPSMVPQQQSEAPAVVEVVEAPEQSKTRAKRYGYWGGGYPYGGGYDNGGYGFGGGPRVVVIKKIIYPGMGGGFGGYPGFGGGFGYPGFGGGWGR
ncbi:hypothetical protein M3Y98_00016600 [Aphelenchoides besseyi]|nr:hypothetical protein M3Y98_00016600 [Aphelenchoides besseyi]KAI6199209.1 hypothetical protein M3Y96_00602100 [Aphelenchoides besseyi]